MKKRNRVMLMTPPYHCGVVESAGRWLPLPLVNMAGSLRGAGFDVAVYDAMSKFHGIRRIAARIADYRPDILGLSACTSTVNAGLRVAATAKKIRPETIVVFGGVHPTFCAEEMLRTHPKLVDFVVHKEGEITLVELANAIENGTNPESVPGLSFLRNGKIVHTPARPYIHDLDSIEPAWDLLDWKDYRYFVIPKSRLAVVGSSRGCDNECAFCSQQKFWERTWRARRPDLFVAEIKHLYDTYGANVFLVCDEFPTRDRARWEEILDRVIALGLPLHLLMETCVKDILRDADIMEKYRRAGVDHIYIGVEATDQATLDEMKKDIRVEDSREAIRIINDAGIVTETSFILGTPGETPEHIEETLRLARYYNPDFAHFLAMTPWPYADAYESFRPYIEIFDYAKYNLVEPIIKPKVMTLAQVDAAIFHCYKTFYMEKLREFRSMKDDFKRNYMYASMKVMMNSSFLTKNLKRLGPMPGKVRELLSEQNNINGKLS